MTLEDVKKLDLLQTRGIAADTKDQQTHAYIVSCLQAFYKGAYWHAIRQNTALRTTYILLRAFRKRYPA